MSSGSSAFSAAAARSGGGPPSASRLATFASAWTPVSVRPAIARRRHDGNTAWRAVRTSPSTVRWPGWAAQPRKSVPSYSSWSRSRTAAALAGGGGFLLLAPTAQQPSPLLLLGRPLRRVVHELQVDHRRRVARARAELHDARVAARPVGEARADLGEQLVHGLLLAQERERAPARREVASPAERDHLLGNRAHLLGLRLGGLDAPVLDQGARQVRVERLAVGAVAPELAAGAAMAHGATRRPSG